MTRSSTPHTPHIGADKKYIVDQGEHHGLSFSFNPDDDRFYVHPLNEFDITLATFAGNQKGFENAVQWARRRQRIGGGK